MDRRSLIAIVMTFVVLLTWQVFFIRPKQKEMTRRRVEQAREQSVTDSLAALEDTLVVGERDEAAAETGDRTEAKSAAESSPQPSDASGGFSSSEYVADVTVTVETEKMLVRLTSIGGEIASVRLKEFTTENGELVELIPQGNRGGFAISLRENGAWKSYSRISFKALLGGMAAEDGAEVVLREGRDNVAIGRAHRKDIFVQPGRLRDRPCDQDREGGRTAAQ